MIGRLSSKSKYHLNILKFEHHLRFDNNLSSLKGLLSSNDSTHNLLSDWARFVSYELEKKGLIVAVSLYGEKTNLDCAFLKIFFI